MYSDSEDYLEIYDIKFECNPTNGSEYIVGVKTYMGRPCLADRSHVKNKQNSLVDLP